MAKETSDSGRPLSINSTAKSASKSLPAFLARPSDAPVYHGFRVLSDVTVDGFIFGAITDLETQESNEGDAFVVAPDNSRAGLVWEISNKRVFTEVCPMTVDRWGVWEVSFPEDILPKLKPKWEQMEAGVREVTLGCNCVGSA